MHDDDTARRKIKAHRLSALVNDLVRQQVSLIASPRSRSSNACSGGPGKVGDGEVDVHLGNPGLGDIPFGRE